ncbi:cupin domain-containing protein [Methylonatrum kenyense]|uniref:cupin domain-containing protein n=1 Tax=Methylonatrum kenyense TaxID=455253 RepID=UPI0020C0605F|nr:cupin domain-containing protein [Methylonatrum kenyense]MCK8515070.1 cupin domain-containing protein [Methylonatrum kenyense]
MKHVTFYVAASVLALGLGGATAGHDHHDHGADGHVFVDPDDLDWGPVASMGEGAEIAMIEGDLSQEEPFTFRLRLADGYRIKPHTHPAYERGTVLQGTLHFAHGEAFDAGELTALREGSTFIMPPGVPMYGQAEGEVIFQLHGTGPWGIDYVNPDHDPRN